MLIAVACLSFVFLAALTVFLHRRFTAVSRDFVFDGEWLSNFTAERYRPLRRLLDEGDVRFLRAEPGFRRELELRLRKSRVGVFRSYIRRLGRDFEKLQAMGKLIVIYRGGNDQLREQLFQQKLAFTQSLIQIHLRLALYQLGGPRFDVSPLLKPVERLTEALQLLPGNAEATAPSPGL